MGQAELKRIDNEGSYVDELKPGTTLLHGQYRIKSFLNAGGFGITYLAEDSLRRKVVIKECFPNSLCHRSELNVEARSQAHTKELAAIVRLFVQEAHSLAKLDHPNIVGVHQVFEENRTAYMVLDFVEGHDLLDIVEDNKEELSAAAIKGILTDVLGAVKFIHAEGMLHRDISPDNILLDAQMRPVLIDFGAAREQATKKSRVLSAMRVVKDGYSPQEFYIQGAEQTPCSDLYALGATFYHLIAGEIPPNSQARLSCIAQQEVDPYRPLGEVSKGHDKNMLASIDKALAILPKDRVQSAQDWLDMMEGHRRRSRVLTKAAPVSSAAAAEAEQQRKTSRAPLLGTVAVLALVAVGGYFATTIQGDAPTLQEAVLAAQTAAALAPQHITDGAAPEAQQITAIVAAPEPEPDAMQRLSPAVPVAIPAPQTAVLPALAAAVAASPRTALAAPSQPTLTPEPEALPARAPQVWVAGPTEALNEYEAPAVPVAKVAAGDAAQYARPPRIPVPAPLQRASLTLEPTVVGPPADPAAPSDPQRNDVLSDWTVDLPFDAPDGSVTISALDANAPDWMQVGQDILAVNGHALMSLNDIVTVLRALTDPYGGQEITARLAIGQAEDGSWIEREITLGIAQETILLNGIKFRTVPDGAGWKTYVAHVPEEAPSDLAVGDVIVTDLKIRQPLNQRTSMRDAVTRALDDGRTAIGFAVERDGIMWMASLTYAGGL